MTLRLVAKKNLEFTWDCSLASTMKESTHYARQLFIYGEGKQKPVRDVKKLAELSGAAERTIQGHIGTWRKEAAEIAARHEDSAYGIALSDETLEQHQREVKFLGLQVKKLRFRLKNVDIGTSEYHVVLSSYQSALTKWEKSSGILAHYDTATAAMKELARAKARVKGKESRPGSSLVPTGKRGHKPGRFDTDS